MNLLVIGGVAAGTKVAAKAKRVMPDAKVPVPPNVGNSARMVAGEKRKIQVGCAVPVPQSCRANREHNPSHIVPVPK